MRNDHDNSQAEGVAYTATDLQRLRDDEQRPWAGVAQALGLGSPGAARRAYSQLVRPHADSVLAKRANPRARVQPVHLADATLDQVREAITGRTIVVERRNGVEDIAVVKVTSISKDGSVNFNDGVKGRTVKPGAIIATK